LKQLERTSLRIEAVGSVMKPMRLLEVIHEAYNFANSLEV
jgi:hypothetical protein